MILFYDKQAQMEQGHRFLYTHVVLLILFNMFFHVELSIIHYVIQELYNDGLSKSYQNSEFALLYAHVRCQCREPKVEDPSQPRETAEPHSATFPGVQLWPYVQVEA